MSRSLTAAVATELQKGRIHPHALVHFAFDSGAVRFWSGIGDLVWSGHTYVGAGSLGSVGAVEESASIRAAGAAFKLSGIPSSLVSIALAEHYQGRGCTMWLAFFDDAGALIADPVQVFSGRVDVMQITDAGETADIKLTAENRLVDFERPQETRYYTDQDQQREYPGDKGFEFVTAIQEAVIVWGREKLAPAVDSTTGEAEVSAPAGEPASGIGDFGVPDPPAGDSSLDINELGVPAPTGGGQTADSIPDFDTGF